MYTQDITLCMLHMLRTLRILYVNSIVCKVTGLRVYVNLH